MSGYTGLIGNNDDRDADVSAVSWHRRQEQQRDRVLRAGYDQKDDYT